MPRATRGRAPQANAEGARAACFDSLTNQRARRIRPRGGGRTHSNASRGDRGGPTCRAALSVQPGMADRRVSCVVCASARRAERTPLSHETNGRESDVFAGLGVALHIRNISRAPIRVRQAPSRAREIRCARWWTTVACALHAVQTKAANRDDATRVERCTPFAVSRALDMHARFLGRRRQTDRARVRLFIVVAPIRRCACP